VCSVDGILLIWLVKLKLRLEEVWDLLNKGMLFSVFKVRNGKDGLVVEVDGIVFGCIMVFARGIWMSSRQGKNDERIFCRWAIPWPYWPTSAVVQNVVAIWEKDWC
jgi:hypothetical protein